MWRVKCQPMLARVNVHVVVDGGAPLPGAKPRSLPNVACQIWVTNVAWAHLEASRRVIDALQSRNRSSGGAEESITASWA